MNCVEKATKFAQDQYDEDESATVESYHSNLHSYLTGYTQAVKDAAKVADGMEGDEQSCSACNGSGHYDHNGSPPCGSCNGTGSTLSGPGDAAIAIRTLLPKMTQEEDKHEV